MRVVRLVPLVLALGLLSGCTTTQDVLAKRFIISAAHAQKSGALAFRQAKLEESVALGVCQGKAQEKNIGLVRSTLDETCADLGAPLPYPAEKLNSFATPLKALHDAAYAAEAARKAAGAVTGNTQDQLGPALTELALRLYDFLRDVKLLPVQDKKAIDKAKSSMAKLIGDSQ